MNLSLLRNTALFADLDEAQLGRVAEICREQTYRSGGTIFREGEPGNPLFTRPDLELLLDFDKDLACIVLRSFVRTLSGRLRATNDSLRTFLSMSMF